MRQIRNFVIGIAVLTLASIANASAQEDGIAKVVAKMGDARYFVPGDSTPHDVKVGMIVKPGVTFQTASGQGNWVDIVLNNASAVAAASGSAPTDLAHYQPKAEQDGLRINENTVISIDKLSRTQTGADVVTDTEMDLKAGSILGTVKKLTPTSKYEVKVPNGVAGIRGTIYFLSASGILRVIDGSVVIAYVGSGGNVITQVVNAGEQFDINTGLVTPIDVNVRIDLIQTSFDFLITGPQTITFVAPDHRIFFVSPVEAGTGTGGGGVLSARK